MIRRKRISIGHGVCDNEDKGPKSRRGQSNQGHSDNSGDPPLLISNATTLTAVAVILCVGYLQHRYDVSRGSSIYTGGLSRRIQEAPSSKKISYTKPDSEKHSLLSSKDDESLEYDDDGIRYHVIFSTDCSDYQHWQSYLVFYTAMKIRQPGHVTRIASGCSDEQALEMRMWFNTQIQFMSRRFHLQLTPTFSGVKDELTGETVGDYKYFNKPFGLKYWMEHTPLLEYDGGNSERFPAKVQNDIVILIDPDMGLLRPITHDFSNPRETLMGVRRQGEHMIASKVTRGKPFAQVYGFGVQWAKLDLATITGDAKSPAISYSHEEGARFFPAGPPYLGTVADMYSIATKWSEFVPRVHKVSGPS
jgi:peptidyl serine alpha-galactosyltransferase